MGIITRCERSVRLTSPVGCGITGPGIVRRGIVHRCRLLVNRRRREPGETVVVVVVMAQVERVMVVVFVAVFRWGVSGSYRGRGCLS